MSKINKIAEGVTLYLGDCREWLPTIDYTNAVLITDPPYGINLGTGRKSDKKHRNWKRETYSSYVDTLENFLELVPPVVQTCLTKCVRGIVFCDGRRINRFPEPADVSAILNSYSSGRTLLGFRTLDFFLFYGRLPNQFHGGAQQKHLRCTHSRDSDIDHPTPKCADCMQELVERLSTTEDTILDPFMGSGSIGIGALQLGRKFIGIEVEPQYFDTACKRIEQALKRPSLLIQKPKFHRPDLINAKN